MTVKDFINKYFIEEIGSLVEERPFVSFVLMAIGIEFLGKCLNANDWDDKNEKSGKTFDDAIQHFDSLMKYQVIPDLYHSLRCGLAHRLMVKGQIILSPNKNDLIGPTFTIGCKDFYSDFRQACIDTINNKNGMIKKNLCEEYDIEIDGITGSTQTANSTVILMRKKGLHSEKKVWFSLFRKNFLVNILRNIQRFLN